MGPIFHFEDFFCKLACNISLEVPTQFSYSKMSRDFSMPGGWDSSWDSTPAPRPLPTSTGHSGSSRQRRAGIPSPTSPQNRDVPRPSRAPNPYARQLQGVPSSTTGREEGKHPIVIAVFGQTGTGKTSFIKAATGVELAVGHTLSSGKISRLCLVE